MLDTLRTTAEQAAGLLARGEVSPEELTAAYAAAIDRPGRRAARVPARRERGGSGRPDRAEGLHHHESGADHGRVEDPRGLRAGLRLDGRRAVQDRRAAADRQDEHGRVCDGLVDRELGLRHVTKPLGPRAGAGRLLRRLGRRSRGRVWRRGRSARTRAARSSNPPRSVASSGYALPTAPSLATGSSRSRRASIRSARSRRPCGTTRSSTR